MEWIKKLFGKHEKSTKKYVCRRCKDTGLIWTIGPFDCEVQMPCPDCDPDPWSYKENGKQKPSKDDFYWKNIEV